MAEQREAHVLDYYQGPSLDGGRPGTYDVNTRPRPRHALASTTFHEAIPGHHFQCALDVEAPDRPALRRFAAELTGAAFAEGWGLYSERLADEMGLYQDGYERLGMLELQALRAARLVVDTGLHALGWPRERALDLLGQVWQPEWEVAVEVDRYVAMPAQARCYKVGQLEIERWRAEAARREGPAFSLARFHDRVLALGALPLATAARELAREGER